MVYFGYLNIWILQYQWKLYSFHVRFIKIKLNYVNLKQLGLLGPNVTLK
jgi:hypothetical protein